MVVAVMGNPPEWGPLGRQRAHERQHELGDPTGLEGTVGKQPVEPGRNPKSTQDVGHTTYQQRHGAHARFNGGKAGDMCAYHAYSHRTRLASG